MFHTGFFCYNEKQEMLISNEEQLIGRGAQHVEDTY